MSYVVYEGLSTPNEVLEKMSDYITRKGYTIVQDLTDDSNIYDRSSNDGKKIVFQDKTNEYFISLRSANGTNIFGTNDDAQMDSLSTDKDIHYYGIGMTVSEGYSKAQRWYNQYNAPLQYRGKDVQGVFMPVTQGTATTVQTRPTKVDYPTPVDEPIKEDYPEAPKREDYPTDAQYQAALQKYQQDCDKIDTDYNNKVADYNEYLQKVAAYQAYLTAEDNYITYLKNKNATGFTYNLYCNEITKPTDTLTFSLVKQGQRVIDKVADPPTRPTPPVKPVKAQYPDEPTKPVVRYREADDTVLADFYGVLVGDNGSDIGCGSVSDLQSYAISITNKLNDLNSSTGTNYSKLRLTLHPMQVVTADTNLQSICDSLGKSDGVTYVPAIKCATISSLTTSSTYDFGMSYSVTSYMTKKDFMSDASISVDVFPYAIDKYKSFKCYYCGIRNPHAQYNYTITSTGSSSKHTYDTTTLYLVPKDLVINEYKSNKANNFELDNIIGYYNQTSPEWVQYKADCKKIDDDYNTAMTQYNTDMTKYQQDMTTYDTAFDAYISNLENGVGITYKDDTTSQLFQTTHLIFGNLDKYDTWTGGAYFSGSATRYMMKTAYKVYEDTDESDEAILPVLSSGEYSNTFLRIDIDDAPTDARGNIYWASSGNDNITGKRLSLPIRVKGQAQNGKIPHYLYLQSQERLDWGRDINTLNCITINMPIYFSVCVDPDAMNLYAPAGAANGIYFISTLNMQTSHTYEIQYPDSNILCEIFPMGKRRGYYGFDGISIYQEEETKTEDNTKASN